MAMKACVGRREKLEKMRIEVKERAEREGLLMDGGEGHHLEFHKTSFFNIKLNAAFCVNL